MRNLDFTELHNLPNGGLVNSDLKDGEHIFVKCRKCNKKLADIWRTKPNAPVVSKITGKCDYCGDSSFPLHIEGRFHIGITDDCSHKDIIFDTVKNASNIIEQNITILTVRN